MLFQSSKHAASAGVFFFGHSLDHIPMLHNFAFVIKSENIHHRLARVFGRQLAMHVQRHQIAISNHAFYAGARLRILFQKRRKGINKRLPAIGNCWVVLPILFAHILVHGLIELVLIKRQFVKRQRVGFVALGGGLRLRRGSLRCGGALHGRASG